MSTNVFSLPVPLVLLIHLHILQYPHANKPEYDHNVFNSRVRGVRDRMKTMEDMCYFFVMRLEGKDGVRKVIPTYPCSQPSDTTAFRTSLAKYLENLRHASVFPSSGKRVKAVVNAPSSEESAHNGAWWWKDVVVRKSLLEECAGEKFERLLLALSTHVLMKGSKSKLAPDETQNVLRSQPGAYTHRLAEFQMSYDTWARTAASLLQRQRDLKLLRANILQHGSCGPTKHARLSTEKLLALTHSKFRELLTDQWAGSGGRSALNFIIELAALRTDSSEGVSSSMDQKENSTSADMHQVPITPPTPLPIAAAHHPGTLRKLSKRIFPKQSLEQQSTAPSNSSSSSHAAVALSRRIDAEERKLQSLKDASARARKTASGLRTRLDRAIAEDASSRRRAGALQPMNVNLWQHAHRVNINFKPQLGDADFAAAGLPVPGYGSQVSIQTRVDEIRGTLRPAYPAIPSSTSIAARGHGHPPGASRLPRRVESSVPQTPERDGRSLGGVMAPETVRPRSRRAREAGTSGGRQPLLDDTGLDKTPRAAPPRRGYDSVEDTDDEDLFQEEGPSMSVRDLLLQADTTCFDIISDGGDFGDQSFGWA